MKTEWISVEERLPEERILAVLIFNGTAPIWNQHVFAGCWFGQSKIFKPEDNHTFIGEITHWMPLPEPPQDSKPK